jgi:hypothetical protein
MNFSKLNNNAMDMCSNGQGITIVEKKRSRTNKAATKHRLQQIYNKTSL